MSPVDLPNAAAALYPKVMILALLKSYGRQSLSQKTPFLLFVHVCLESPLSPCNGHNTKLWLSAAGTSQPQVNGVLTAFIYLLNVNRSCLSSQLNRIHYSQHLCHSDLYASPCSRRLRAKNKYYLAGHKDR